MREDAAGVSRPSGVLTGDELRRGLSGPIEPVDLSLGYRLGVFLVAVVMVLLPLLYIAIIVLVGLAVRYHVTHHTVLLRQSSFMAVLGVQVTDLVVRNSKSYVAS